MSLVIQPENGVADQSSVKIVPFKSIHRENFPFSLLPRDSTWENGSSHPFRPCIIPADVSSFSDFTFAKVYEENKKSSGSVSHLAVIERIYGDIWSLNKLDKATRMRDIRAIDDKANKSISTSGINAYETTSTSHTNSEWNISNITITPTWHDYSNEHIEALMNIDMSYPNPSENSVLPPINNEINPELFLSEKYSEILYNTTLPLVYFAKSTLSKLRSICKDPDNSDDTKLKKENINDYSKLVMILSKSIIRITQLDDKYELTNQSTNLLFNNWLQKIKKDASNNQEIIQNQLSTLKIREIQLQIILLLEISAHNGGNNKIQSDINSTPSNSISLPNNRKSIVRKKKKPELKRSITPEPSTSITYDDYIDILFDRLCISEAISSQPLESTDKSNKRDKVQEFCLEILLPFFASRLGEKTKQMLRKARGLSSRSKPTKRSDSVTIPTPIITSLPMTRSLSLQDTTSITRDIIPSDTTTEELTTSIPPLIPTPAPTTTPIIASKTHSLRGGFLSTKNNQQKRQVDIVFAMKKQQKESMIADELANAIKNISKPNRLSVADELAMSKPPISQKAIKVHRRRTYTAPVTEPTSILQVAGNGVFATPSKKRIINLPEYHQPSPGIDRIVATPQKRQKFDDTITSSPSFIASTPSTIRRSLNFDEVSPNIIMATPSKGNYSAAYDTAGYDTDDDMMHID